MLRPLAAFFAVIAILIPIRSSESGPITREEGQRQAQVMERLEKAVAAEPTAATKFAAIARGMQGEPAVEVRRRILEIAIRLLPGPEREAFLTDLLTSEPDAGLRSQAAKDLGLHGSENALAALARCAAEDRTTELRIGDIGGRSSARRAATFAIAELAARHGRIADDAAAKLRALPAADDPKDNAGLADARAQALYQVTRDDALLAPFRERLKSKDAAERERGIVAFRFLKLKTAPPEVAAAMNDPSPGVRQWAALVLGEIGDPKSADALMAAAADVKQDRNVRCNAIQSLGRMRATAAAGLMEKLLTDEDPGVPGNAAVALYRITGKKVVQFPEGYNAD